MDNLDHIAKLEAKIKLLATDNEKLARENERLQEEATLLKIRHEELIEEANKSSANAHRLLNEVALLTKGEIEIRHDERERIIQVLKKLEGEFTGDCDEAYRIIINNEFSSKLEVWNNETWRKWKNV